MAQLHNMFVRLLINAARCWVPLCQLGVALAGTTRALVAHWDMGLPGGGVLVGGVGGGGRGADFAARPPPLSCRADNARLITRRTPRVMDQDLRRLDVWLGNCQCLAGMMAGLLSPVHWHRLVFVFVAGGSILLGHGVVLGARGTPTASRGG
jgi:hypothetical protein